MGDTSGEKQFVANKVIKGGKGDVSDKQYKDKFRDGIKFVTGSDKSCRRGCFATVGIEFGKQNEMVEKASASDGESVLKWNCLQTLVTDDLQYLPKQ